MSGERAATQFTALSARPGRREVSVSSTRYAARFREISLAVEITSSASFDIRHSGI